MEEIVELDLIGIRYLAYNAYDDANCKYDGNDYSTHINMVSNLFINHYYILKKFNDITNIKAAIYLHDVIEDANLSYNDVLKIANKDVADIVLAVTDIPAENRLLKRLLTLPKTIKDYRAIIVKMCDICSNAQYSKLTKSSMHKKYCDEYKFIRPIFKTALNWFKDELDFNELNKLWIILDEAHNFTEK